MEIENLRIFVEVARRGSFASVARDRDVDPSLISRAVALLEDELGARLLQRTTRQLALTEAGEIYLARISALVDDFDRAQEEVRGVSSEPTGTLRLTASVAFGQTCLVPFLPEFRERYPGIKLELLLTDTVVDVISERVDLAIRLAKKFDADLVATKLFDTKYRVCASPSYIKEKSAPKIPQDLEQHSCLLFALPDFRSRWKFLDKQGIEQVIPVHGDVTILNALALRSCALAGMGPVLLANWLIDEDVSLGRLIDLFPDYRVTATEFDTAVWLMYPSKKHLPSKVRAMIDFLKEKL